MSKLYLVGTPIGNLGDISPRALEVLSNVDFIAAEDTRVTLKLLNHFEIKKPLVTYQKFTTNERAIQLVERIAAGESCAIVTDAGMPCISDPGEELVNLCHNSGISIETVPGPSALITALAASGLPTGRFTFEGFLSTNANSRKKHLESLVNETRTLIFYEAPHKLKATLRDMAKYFGENRRVTLCRELTKIHEEFIRTTFLEAMEIYSEKEPRGEYVLVVEGAEEIEEKAITFDEAIERIKLLCDEGESLARASKQVALETGYKKNELYKEIVKRENN